MASTGRWPWEWREVGQSRETLLAGTLALGGGRPWARRPTEASAMARRPVAPPKYIRRCGLMGGTKREGRGPMAAGLAAELVDACVPR